MSDIVERLRQHADRRKITNEQGETHWLTPGPVMDEAAAEITRLRAELAEAQAEVDRLHSWSGIMWLLEKHYSSDVFTGVSGDPGAVTVVALREIDTLRTQLAVLQQGCGDMCDKCGWRCLFPGEGCVNCDCHTLRAELEAERTVTLGQAADIARLAEQLAVAREGLAEIRAGVPDGMSVYEYACFLMDTLAKMEKP